LEQLIFREKLNKNTKYQHLLYRRGYLITTKADLDLAHFPFYDNWSKCSITEKYILYIHKEQHYYIHTSQGVTALLIGHAYNPYNGKYKEEDILTDLLDAYLLSERDFFDKLSELTGIHLVCIFSSENNLFVQDATAMKACYYGTCSENTYITSHCQLISDIDKPKRNEYIDRLLHSHSYLKWGSKYLPGDLTVFDDFRRLGPNVCLKQKGNDFSVRRFYPVAEHKKANLSDQNTIEQIAEIIKSSVLLTKKKWNTPAISLSGGIDSRTTLSAAHGQYEDFKYYSFDSKTSEGIDAKAAGEICKTLSIPHHIYRIPEDNACFENWDLCREIIARNSAYVSIPNDNEIRKYIYFSNLKDFDVELKSWASEIGRAFWERRVGVVLPATLKPRHFNIFQTRYFGNPILMWKGDRAYREYLEKTENTEPLFNYEHSDCFCWEYRFGSWGTIVTTGQDIFDFEVTMPLNNRKLMDMFLWFSHDERKNDLVHKAIIEINDNRLSSIKTSVKNHYFGRKRVIIEKAYYLFRTFFI